jgi:hypothetical protein
VTDMVFGSDGFDVEIGGGAVETANDLYAGNRITKAGFYHVVCEGVEMKKGDDETLQHLIVNLQVLDGSDVDDKAQLRDQIGKKLQHRLYFEGWEYNDGEKVGKKPIEDKAWTGIRTFSYAFGLITEAELKQAKPRINFRAIEGRQAVVKVTKQKDYEDRKTGNTMAGGYKISWNNDAWPVTHPKVKDVHKDREHLALLVGPNAGNDDI